MLLFMGLLLRRLLRLSALALFMLPATMFILANTDLSDPDVG